MSDLPPPPSWERPPLPPPPPARGVSGQTAPPAVPPIGPPRSSAYGYGLPLQPGANARPLDGLATALTVLLVCATGAAAFAALALMRRARLVDDALGGDFGSVARLGSADDRVAASLGLFIVTLLATAAVFITWQWRHAKNAEALGGRLELGPGWAIGGWLIPLGNYVVPIIQLWQSAKASDPDATVDAGGQPHGRVPGIVLAWAIGFMGASLSFTLTSSFRPQDVGGSFATTDRIGAAGFGVYVIAGVLAIAMVRTLTDRQQRATAKRMAEPYVPPQQPPPPAAARF